LRNAEDGRKRAIRAAGAGNWFASFEDGYPGSGV